MLKMTPSSLYELVGLCLFGVQSRLLIRLHHLGFLRHYVQLTSYSESLTTAWWINDIYTELGVVLFFFLFLLSWIPFLFVILFNRGTRLKKLCSWHNYRLRSHIFPIVWSGFFLRCLMLKFPGKYNSCSDLYDSVIKIYLFIYILCLPWK